MFAVDDVMMFAAIMRQLIAPLLNLDTFLLLVIAAAANIDNIAADADGYCGNYIIILMRQ